jgi:glutamate formiminotransferase/formiminotetrahydrofolate cyclodeaminase
LNLVDADTESFNQIMAAYRLPKATDNEIAARKDAIAQATKGAIHVPLEVMKASLNSMEVMREMARSGLNASISDAGVGAMCALTAVRGAYLNVRINCAGFADKDFVANALATAEDVMSKAKALEASIMKEVMQKL